MRPLAATWLALSATLLWTALRTTSSVAWLAFVLAMLLPALMLMVMAQTPDKAIARIIHEAESAS